MIAAKIGLSAEEQELAASMDFILTKNEITRKLLLFFGELSKDEKNICSASALPAEVFSVSPKISKGENYKGFPWIVLDYPRIFEKENLPDRKAGVFAIRTMFWWGHFFSVTLHLAGKYKSQFEKKILDQYVTLKNKDIYCCIGEDQWQHHFDENNYKLVKTLTEKEFKEKITGKSFLKIASKLESPEWSSAGCSLARHYSQLIKVVES